MIAIKDSLVGLEFDFDSFKNRTYLTHNYHPYPAKFAPQIPLNIILALSEENDVVLDPFCGSGTTLVECLINNRNAIGIDSNPIASLASKVKTKLLSPQEINECRQITSEILSASSIFSKDETSSKHNNKTKHEMPHFFNIDHWFEPCVQNELSFILNIIKQKTAKHIQDFLLLTASSIITSVSNQDSDTRYAKKTKNIKPGDTLKKFISKSEAMCKRMNELRARVVYQKTNVQVYNNDSRNLKFIKSNTVDLVVTSPPYMNTYDYYLYHRNRMNWLGMDSKSVQKLEIGSRNKHCDENMDASHYFDMINECLQEMTRVLKKGKFLAIVIGDSIKDGRYIKMDLEYEKMLEKFGFVLVKKTSYSQRNYTTSFTKGLKKRHKLGHILIFINKL